jgi:hypothetical protein
MDVKLQRNKIRRSHLRQKLCFNLYYNAMPNQKLEHHVDHYDISNRNNKYRKQRTCARVRSSYMDVKLQRNMIRRSHLRQKLCFNLYYNAMPNRKLSLYSVRVWSNILRETLVKYSIKVTKTQKCQNAYWSNILRK